ncbi:MAG: glyoxylate/hydroxypyruvate reductase A [Alphaproteobacteria bacterium]|nr:glyoxylate/hydroxypyruvate reductase A [Alphaproteobacteria bacterium]
MAVLIIAKNDRPDWWADQLRRNDPSLDVRVWPDAGDPADIEYALAWKPRPGELAKYPNLKAVFSLGAGVDHLFSDPEFPAGAAVSRVIDPYLTAGIREYVLLHVLRYHKNQPALDMQQREHVWDDRGHELKQADERRVGILGLGELGTASGKALAALGFDVAGWSRSPKDIPGIACHHGPDGLDELAARTDILVCLLPLTPETEGILNAGLFAKLPAGAYLINAGRGGHLVEDDLIPALESGRLAHATLDVFRNEPLPRDHPFWDHPRITVTPHNASITDPRSVARQIADGIAAIARGEPVPNAVDRELGY